MSETAPDQRRGYDPESARARRARTRSRLARVGIALGGLLGAALVALGAFVYGPAIWPAKHAQPAAVAPVSPPMPAAQPPATPPLPASPPVEAASPPTGEPSPEQPAAPEGETRTARLLSRIEPEYPRLAREARMSGAVVVHAVISDEGRVMAAQAENGSNPVLAEAAVAAVRGWRYDPALLRGRPVFSDLSVTINFSLTPGR